MIEPAPPPPPPAHAFVMTGVGRFVVFADIASIRQEPDAVVMRALQVVEADFTIGTTQYLGGWSWWRFDCDDRTVDRLDFASVAVGGTEGPPTLDYQPPYPAIAGGDAAELMDVACRTVELEVVATTVAHAVRIGRAAMLD